MFLQLVVIKLVLREAKDQTSHLKNLFNGTSWMLKLMFVNPLKTRWFKLIFPSSFQNLTS